MNKKGLILTQKYLGFGENVQELEKWDWAKHN